MWNFKVKEDSTGNTRVVHHNRMSPLKLREIDITNSASADVDDSSSSSEEKDEDDEDENPIEEPAVERRYPVRNRTQRIIPGAIPWEVWDAR